MKRSDFPSDMELISKWLDNVGDDHPENDVKATRNIEINASEIEPVYCDAFRKVRRFTPSQTRGSTARRMKPVVILRIGKYDFAILNLSVFYQFVNEILFPERLSFEDFKGIIQTFVPLTFLRDILKNNDNKLMFGAKENEKGNLVIHDVRKESSTVTYMGYEPLVAYVQERVPGESLVSAKYKSSNRPSWHRRVVMSWDNCELELTQQAKTFTMCARYHAGENIIMQPCNPVSFTGSWDSVEADKIIEKVDECIDSLVELNQRFVDSEDYHTPHVLRTFTNTRHVGYPSNLTFKQRNSLERERYSLFLQSFA